MDDFYAECDEHLGEIRAALLQLEPFIGAGLSESGPSDGLRAGPMLKLFRSYHSLKGILGMAGLHLAESIAHRTEDYLRSLTQDQAALNENGFATLSSAVELLEQSVMAHRQSQPLPDASGLLAKLTELSGSQRAAPAPTFSSVPASSTERLQAARARGLTLWECLFEPTQELAGQGKSVNTARARVESLGEILHSAPRIEKAGRIAFEFIVGVSDASNELPNWAEEGITVRPYLLPAYVAAGSESVQEPGQPSTPAFVAPSHIVRVNLTRLDELMRIMGDMVVHRARLEEISSRIAAQLSTGEARALQEVHAAFGRELRNLRDGLMRVRLVSIGEIFQRLPFVVRDLARESGSKIRLTVTGQETEVDKYLVERLKDPLLHLVRNAVCHGVEPAEERVAQNKPAEATIALRATTLGESVVIEVSDDGRGLNERELVRRARARGLNVPEHPDSGQLLELICQPGFSTRDEADRGAGRGVGMSAVKNTVTELGGQLSLQTASGVGTTFTVRLPLTLAIADALIIAVGGQRFAMPQVAVQEITMADRNMLRVLERSEVMSYRNGVLPLVRLSTLFELASEPQQEFPVLVIGNGRTPVGVAADRLLGQREIVVRAVNDPLLKVPAIAGATELGDGHPVLIIDVDGLIESARRRLAQPTKSSLSPLKRN